MNKLQLNFLDQQEISAKVDPIERVLHDFGEEIYAYAKEYFNYIVTTTTENDNVSDASLYIFVPEIGYNYKILEVSYNDAENVTVRFYTLKSRQTEETVINIKAGLNQLYEKISNILNTKLANEIFRFLVNQVRIKKETRESEEA